MKRCGAPEFLQLAQTHPVFDVRTPSEFDDGHIPGAHNLPLFSDEERAEIGTMYKHEGRQPAILRGLDFVGPKMRPMVEQVLAETDAPGPVLVHCWRGGMRSSSVGWLLDLYGFEVVTLEGGYKAYRHHVLDTFETPLAKLTIIGGLTGVGKTEILHELAAMGEQVIDLEGLANHRGSAFGGIERDEPTQQEFENNLSAVIESLDPTQRIWVEDESRLVGHKCVPDALWEQKEQAPVVRIEVSDAERLDRLVEEYGEHPLDELETSFRCIAKRLGGKRLQISLDALQEGDLRTAAAEALAYYDKAYGYGLDQHEAPTLAVFDFDERPSSAEIARRCVDAVESQ